MGFFIPEDFYSLGVGTCVGLDVGCLHYTTRCSSLNVERRNILVEAIDR